MKQILPLIAILATTSAMAEETRQLNAHEHGVGALNIAVDGATVAMEFHAPGADIVGFEYVAKSKADLAAVDAAVAKLSAPLDLFVLPAIADCSVKHATAELESESVHNEHESHDGETDHSEHGEHVGEGEHADHEKHANEAGHTEFRADYTFSCGHLDALTEITFAYFDIFENAQELDVQIVTSLGAAAFEVMRDAPVIDLRGLF